MTVVPRSRRSLSRSAARRKSRRLRNWAFVAPALAFLIIFSLYPMVVMVQMSLARIGAQDILKMWPFVGLDNYTDVLNSHSFRQVAVQTLLLVIFIVILTIGIGLVVAFILRMDRPMTRITQTIMVFVWVLPPVIVGSLWKFLLTTDGVINQLLLMTHLIHEPIAFLVKPGVALTAVGAVMLWTGIPFATLILKAAILDIPLDVLDAAAMDGASPWQVATRIIIPMIKAVVLTLVVLTVVGAFKTFDLIYIMTTGGPGTSTSTIPFLAYLTAFRRFDYGAAAAMSVLSMVAVLIVTAGYIAAVAREAKS